MAISSHNRTLQLLAFLGGVAGVLIIAVVGFWLMRPAGPTAGKLAGGEGVGAEVAATGAAGVQADAEGTVDLLKLVDLTRDNISGNWVADNSVLKGTGPGAVQIELPYRPPAEYDLTVRFQREQGTGDVVVICAAGNGTGGGGGEKQFAWNMGGEDNHLAGFGSIKGAAYRKNATTKRADAWVTNGMPQVLVIRVREDHLEVALDGREVLNAAVDYKDVGLWPGFAQHDKHTLGIHCSSPLTVLEVRVAEVTGHGVRMR